MDTTVRRRLFNWTFLFLSLLWILYVGVLYPIHKRNQSPELPPNVQAECADHTVARDNLDCIELPTHLEVTQRNRYSFAGYYGHGGLISIAVAGLGLPLLVYGIIVGFLGFGVRFRNRSGREATGPQS
jgi:hypothetical protein